MNWLFHRHLPLTVLFLLALLACFGCTSKEDPSEVLVQCGNHSCGTLTMVTTDTTSDGFNYLDPSLSPDGSRILFTADWWAIPADPKADADDLFTNNRQMVMMPKLEGMRPPALSLEEQGGELIYLLERSIPISGSDFFLQEAWNINKGSPVWVTNDTIVYWLQTLVGPRMMRSDISDPENTVIEPIYFEPTDATASPPNRRHLELVLSEDKRWLAFTRSGCVIPDSFETCTGLSIWVLDMNTAGINDGYGAIAHRVTNDYSRVEAPSWSPDGSKLVFGGGLDVDGGIGAGLELFTIDFDSTSWANEDLDRNLTRLTYTSYAEGDPISGILNTSPIYASNGSSILFISSRRAPSITLHDRNIWKIPADGSLEPVMYYFTRDDESDPSLNADGSIVFSSFLGFPTENLNWLEEEAYEEIYAENEANGGILDEVQMRNLAAAKRKQLEFFEGVISYLYIYRP